MAKIEESPLVAILPDIKPSIAELQLKIEASSPVSIPRDIKPSVAELQQNENIRSAPSRVPYVVIFRKHAQGSNIGVKTKKESSELKFPKTEEDESSNGINKCDRCSKTFEKRWQLLVHVKVHAQEIANRQKRRSEIKLVSDDGQMEHRCVCGEAFSSKWFLTVHMRTHTGENLRPHKCETCKKVFLTNNHLIMHIRSHTGDKPYACDVCNNSYTRATSLAKHKKTHRNGVERKIHHNSVEKKIRRVRIGHNCKICNKRFCRKSVMLQHLNIHSDERLYKCDTCDKAYRFASSLFLHKKRVHKKLEAAVHQSVESPGGGESSVLTDPSGCRPYKCKFCSLRFKYPKRLEKHMDGHDSKTRNDSATRNQKVVCDVCGKCFRDRYYMIQHVKMRHLGEKLHVCEICNKSFLQRGHLVKHRRSHTGEKPFCCEFCNKLFVDSSSMNRHKKVHTGEKPHTCGICGKSFAEKYKATKHKLQHSSELNNSEPTL